MTLNHRTEQTGNAERSVYIRWHETVENTYFASQKKFKFLRKNFKKTLAYLSNIIYTKKACLRR